MIRKKTLWQAARLVGNMDMDLCEVTWENSSSLSSSAQNWGMISVSSSFSAATAELCCNEHAGYQAR